MAPAVESKLGASFQMGGFRMDIDSGVGGWFDVLSCDLVYPISRTGPYVKPDVF